ncbi:MAG: oligosaccharide flippase family protein [Ignavibacteriaceae bacterium]|nr:oligosaccharide flippase family protein [Ignavibacteriaceae bacterium]
MLSKLKQLTKETALYGLSTIVGRFLNFLLLPLYTNVFLPGDYGIITNVYAYIAILSVIFLYGIDSAYLKFLASDEHKDKKLVFSTGFNFLLITSVLIILLMLITRDPLNNVLRISGTNEIIFYYLVLILILDTIISLPLVYLRVNNQALKFSLIRIVNIIVAISLNMYLLLVLKTGIEGAFISNLIASLSSFLLLLPIIMKNYVFAYDKELLKRMIKFGLPYLPAGISAMMLQVIDRPIVEYLTDLKTLGIYQANYRLGIVMMLFVSMFQYAWQPFSIKIAKEEDAEQVFAKVMTLFTAAGAVIIVLMILFIDYIIKFNFGGGYIIGKPYWGGTGIIPIVLLGYLFNGFHVVFSASFFIKEKSGSAPLIMGAGAIANVLFNFLLIPYGGIYGAALATLISYVIIAVGYFIVSQRLYPIRYEYSKLYAIIFLILVTWMMKLYIQIPYLNTLAYNAVLFVLFISGFFMFRVVRVEDIKKVIPKIRSGK